MPQQGARFLDDVAPARCRHEQHTLHAVQNMRSFVCRCYFISHCMVLLNAMQVTQ
jgi:hypothetical protein